MLPVAVAGVTFIPHIGSINVSVVVVCISVIFLSFLSSTVATRTILQPVSRGKVKPYFAVSLTDSIKWQTESPVGIEFLIFDQS